tara:strand:- start:86 stop:484 length:399 start_codon:yes stop_codon:yes gene_type:complete
VNEAILQAIFSKDAPHSLVGVFCRKYQAQTMGGMSRPMQENLGDRLCVRIGGKIQWISKYAVSKIIKLKYYGSVLYFRSSKWGSTKPLRECVRQVFFLYFNGAHKRVFSNFQNNRYGFREKFDRKPIEFGQF